ncbi:MAG: polysaccharide biosynthesis/export family protein, partial [Candidatus Tenebribacter mawsonii]|nr:polysaccharide biosynthesis/export family protein [Candidatus Tenebribacter mawsonii]
RSNYLLFIFSIIIIIASCSRPLKEMTYMYDVKDSIYPDGPIPDDYKIKVNDQLYISVIGDEPEITAFLNLSQQESGGDLELITYLVDESGDIYFLALGKMHVVGLTIKGVRDILLEKVDKYIANVSVFVKLVGSTITVLGEVGSPGQHEILKNRVNIFEALGTAGDVTDWGNYEDVMLIRGTPEGKLVTHINLLDPNLIDSPYYYILPNDVLYVKLESKVWGSKNMGPFAFITFGLSMLTTAMVLITFFGK